MKTVSIGIATQNMRKIEAIKSIFEKYFTELEIKYDSSDSGVPEQPVNDEVFEGAKNRIEDLKKKNPDFRQCDYLIACEGGMLQLYGSWFNVQIVQIEDKYGQSCMGISQGMVIPDDKVERIIQNGLAKTFDETFGEKGGMRVLTNGMRNRENFIEEATLMAISGLLSKKIW